MATFQTIIAAYKQDYQHNAAQEQRWFEIQPTLADAVSMAALAQAPSGKRLSHQCRIPGSVLEQARALLMRHLERFEQIRDFDDLHAEIDTLTGNIAGIGELYVYDTALRIGAKLGIKPKHVYVHAGVREGIRNLGLDPKQPRIPIVKLPAPFRTLDAFEIEDVLCIYKHQLAGAAIIERNKARCYPTER